MVYHNNCFTAPVCLDATHRILCHLLFLDDRKGAPVNNQQGRIWLYNQNIQASYWITNFRRGRAKQGRRWKSDHTRLPILVHVLFQHQSRTLPIFSCLPTSKKVRHGCSQYSGYATLISIFQMIDVILFFPFVIFLFNFTSYSLQAVT